MAAQSFSPNFRITDESFDPDVGRQNIGGNETYLGDAIGLAMTDGAMYVASTDTQQGSQDIFFRRVALDSGPPAPLSDRFEPNDSVPSATVLGPISAPRRFPKLATSARRRRLVSAAGCGDGRVNRHRRFSEVGRNATRAAR